MLRIHLSLKLTPKETLHAGLIKKKKNLQLEKHRDQVIMLRGLK